MKKFVYFLSAVLSLLMLSCSQDSTEPAMEGYAPVCVHVSDFSITTSDFSSARTRAVETPTDYESVKSIILAFYDSEGNEVYKSTQVQDDTSTYPTTFGVFTFNLPIGTYTMVAIGRDVGTDDAFTLTSSTEAAYTSERVRETFSAMQSVTVSSTTALNLTVTMNRIVTMLNIYSTDKRPSGVVKIRTTYGKGSKSFNPSTGMALDSNGFSLTNTPNQSVGQTVALGNYSFLPADEQSMDITLEALDADNNVLITKVVTGVPLKRNRVTTLRGPLFTPSTSSSATFQLETSWIDGNTVNF